MTKPNLHTTTYTDDCLFCQEHLEEAALRNLEPEVQERMECHLLRCSMCRAELAQIEASLQVLALSVDQVEPPPSVKANLMSRFEAERDRGGDVVSMRETTPRPNRPAKPRVPSRLPWAYGSVFAGVMVALLVIGAWNFLPLDRSNGDLPRGQIQVMAMENTCPDCHHETGGQIGADPKEKDGLVMAWNLDPTRTHEVWCVNRDGQHTKVGDLAVGDSGSAMQTFSFPEEVGGYQQIYVIRDDGAEELTVAPAGREDGEPQDTDPTPPEE